MRFLAAILAGLLLVGGLHSAEGPSFQEREALAKLQAMDIFPDLEKEDSMLAAQVADEVKRLEKEQPAFFKEAAWPLRAARRAAALLGILPRTVAQIRASLTNDFDVDPADLQHIHGIRIVAARFTTGGEWLDVTPQIAALMTERGNSPRNRKASKKVSPPRILKAPTGVWFSCLSQQSVPRRWLASAQRYCGVGGISR